MEFLVVLLVVGGMVILLRPWIMRRRGIGGPNADLAPGTLLVTGVSAGADSNDSQIVTIAGVINGPTVSEHEVYSRMVMAVGQSPTIGELIPVLYAPKNPDKWTFAPSEAVGPPDRPEPY